MKVIPLSTTRGIDTINHKDITLELEGLGNKSGRRRKLLCGTVKCDPL